jgi:hypothetical protein
MTDSSVPDSGPGGHRGKLGLRKQALDIRCRRCCSCMATAGYANRPSRCSTRKGRHERPLTRLIRCSARLRLTPSSCYHHPVKSGTSEWELHQDTQSLRHIFVLSSCCDSVSSTGASRYPVSWHARLTRLARTLFNTTGTHAL